MSRRPVVTVLMSTYNDAPYLAESVESVLGQTFGDFEFLIIDARFPRSVMHGLVAASDCLRKVGQSKPGHAAVGRAQRLLGQLRAHLEYAPIDEVVADLDAEMARVQDVCADVAENLTNCREIRGGNRPIDQLFPCPLRRERSQRSDFQ